MRPLLNAGDLIAWARKDGFKKTLVPSEWHVTVAFSRDKVDWAKLKPSASPLVVTANSGRAVKPLGEEGAVVLRFESAALSNRWKEIRDAGASWDWPSYQPHVTITYDGGDVDWKNVKPYTGILKFGPEQFSELDEDHKDKVAERATAA